MCWLVLSELLLSFIASAFVGFLLLSKRLFSYLVFFLTISDAHGTLHLSDWYELCCSSLRAMTKFFLSFISDISWGESNLFLTINLYQLLISLLVNEDQSERVFLIVLLLFFLFLRIIQSISFETILWSEDSPSKEVYLTYFRALFIHFLLMSI